MRHRVTHLRCVFAACDLGVRAVLTVRGLFRAPGSPLSSPAAGRGCLDTRLPPSASSNREARMSTTIACTSLSFTWPDGTSVFEGLDVAFGPGRTGLVGV